MTNPIIHTISVHLILTRWLSVDTRLVLCNTQHIGCYNRGAEDVIQYPTHTHISRERERRDTNKRDFFSNIFEQKLFVLSISGSTNSSAIALHTQAYGPIPYL